MKNKIYTGMLLGCFLLCGCSDWLDVKPYDKISYAVFCLKKE